ncbi:hypothetical protein ST4_097 [Aeromonas phage ST4]|nr:hypothetical protein ST4_097 [Aeromonas phage ST4]
MSKYDRTIIGTYANGNPVAVKVDVYRVLAAFQVTDPALQHLLKKALCAGLRGHKDREQDLLDIQLSAEKAVDMFRDEQELAKKDAGVTFANAPTGVINHEHKAATPSHAQMMAGYEVACRFGVLEARAFELAEQMFKAMKEAGDE